MKKEQVGVLIFEHQNLQGFLYHLAATGLPEGNFFLHLRNHMWRGLCFVVSGILPPSPRPHTSNLLKRACLLLPPRQIHARIS